MKKIIFIVIIFIGIILRFILLGANPPSLDWDEASLGYNAYSILKTGADEYGNKFPLSIRSFDDYKPPLYVYLDIPSVAFLGLNEFSVRLPSAIAGVLLIIVTYYLVLEFLKDSPLDKKKIGKLDTHTGIALLASFFVAISPWSLQFSRAAFEGNIGILFLSLGVLFLLKGFGNKWYFIGSVLAFVLAMYSYHSFRLVIPVFIFLTSLIWWKQLWKEKLMVFISGLLFVVLILPIFINFFSSSSGSASRLSMVSSFGDSSHLTQSIKEQEYDTSQGDKIGGVFHNRRVVFSQQFLKGYLDHWNLDFLFLHGDGGVQHHAVDVGMLYLWDLPFILIGLYALFRNPSKRMYILFIWFLVAPIASAITTGTPHPVRAIAMIPPFHIFAAIGFVTFYMFFESKKRGIMLIGIILLMLLVNIGYYFHQYYIHTPVEYGYFWQYGYKDVFATTKQLENKYSHIVVTYQYDQPYIYYLFYNKIDPAWYQKNWDTNQNGMVDRFRRVIGKYEFRNIDWSKDKDLKNTLFVGTPREISQDVKEKIQEVKFLDGSTAFVVVGT